MVRGDPPLAPEWFISILIASAFLTACRQRYYRAPESLKHLPTPVYVPSQSLQLFFHADCSKRRKYYERNNAIISHYLYIDRLLDSSLPHNLIDDYNDCGHSHPLPPPDTTPELTPQVNSKAARIKRTPHNLYRIPDETAPLLEPRLDEEACSTYHSMPDMGSHERISPEKEERLINLAIQINFVANVLLLASKVAIMVLTSSMSVLAGLVDGVLDFLSTVIIWITTTMIRRQDRNRYPISRRRLEPLSVLVFSVIMVTSFFQVGLTSVNRLMDKEHPLVELSIPSIALMAGTVIVKLLCWLWCRLIPSPSVQVLAQDAMTDVVFNTFSIIFPLSMQCSLLAFLSPSILSHVPANPRSWLFCSHLVPRSSRRTPSLGIHHVELGINRQRVYSTTNRSSRFTRGSQYLTLHDDALFSGHPENTRPQGLLRR